MENSFTQVLNGFFVTEQSMVSRVFSHMDWSSHDSLALMSVKTHFEIKSHWLLTTGNLTKGLKIRGHNISPHTVKSEPFLMKARVKVQVVFGEVLSG